MYRLQSPGNKGCDGIYRADAEGQPDVLLDENKGGEMGVVQHMRIPFLRGTAKRWSIVLSHHTALYYR